MGVKTLVALCFTEDCSVENKLIFRMYSTNTSCPRTGFGEVPVQQLLQIWQASSQPSSASQCKNNFLHGAADKHGMIHVDATKVKHC